MFGSKKSNDPAAKNKAKQTNAWTFRDYALLLTFAVALTALILAAIYSGRFENRLRSTEEVLANVNRAAISNVAQTSIDITGTYSSYPSGVYQYVAIRRSNGAVTIDSDETPSASLPLYDSSFISATFSSATIADGDVVTNILYGGSTTNSLILAEVSFLVFQICFVDTITLVPICYQNGEYCSYPFQIDPDGDIIDNKQEAVDYVSASAGNGTVINDSGCFTVLLPPYYACCASTATNTTNIPVQIVDRRFIMTYATAGGTVEYNNLAHSTVGNDCADPTVIASTQDFYIDYGDGTPRGRVTGSLSTTHSHTYSGAPAFVNVTIYGILPSWSSKAVLVKNAGGIHSDIREIIQWGNTGLLQVDFDTQIQLQTITIGPPQPSSVVDMSFFFHSAGIGKAPSDKPWNAVTGWDLDHVQNFASMFSSATSSDTTLNVGSFGMSSALNTCKMFLNYVTPISGFD